eukprot:6112027-Prymnesium_polylepis.1
MSAREKGESGRQAGAGETSRRGRECASRGGPPPCSPPFSAPSCSARSFLRSAFSARRRRLRSTSSSTPA